MKKLIWLICLFIVACGNSSDEISFLASSTCELPCWKDVVVGRTTEEELLEILAKSPDIDSDSIQNNDQTWDIFDHQITFSFRQGRSFEQQPQLRGYAYINDGIIRDLLFCGELNTNIETLVKTLGEPGYVISGNNFSGGRLVVLIHSKIGVSYLYTAKLSNLELTPDTKIDCVQMFDPSFFEKMLEAGLFSGGYYKAEETLKAMYPWNGYGNLDEKYPSRQP